MFQQYKTEIKWAVYYSIFLLLWTTAERIAGLHDHHIALQQNLSILLLIPAVIFYVLQLIDKRKSFFDGNMSYVQGFFSGIIFTVCIMILAPFVQFISYYIISPHYFANLIKYSVSNNLYTKDQAAQQFNYGNFLFINEVFQMITGVVFAAFVALFLKNDSASESHS